MGRKKIYFGLFVLWLALTPAVYGQRIQHGEVIDVATQAKIPGVTVQIEGKSGGAITNANGGFQLFLQTLPAVLVVRHIGYSTKRISIDDASPTSIKIKLSPISHEMEEIVVSGEDPAVDIMRRVIKRKQQRQQQISNYYAEVYTRFKLYNERQLVQIEERIDASYWRPEKGTREVVRAIRTNPRKAGVFKYAAPEYVPNFYDNNISIRGFNLVGPTHPDALKYYRFTLGGER